MPYYSIVSGDGYGFYENWTGVGWHRHPAYALMYVDHAQAEEVMKEIIEKPSNGGVPEVMEHPGLPPSWARIAEPC